MSTAVKEGKVMVEEGQRSLTGRDHEVMSRRRRRQKMEAGKRREEKSEFRARSGLRSLMSLVRALMMGC